MVTIHAEVIHCVTYFHYKFQLNRPILTNWKQFAAVRFLNKNKSCYRFFCRGSADAAAMKNPITKRGERGCKIQGRRRGSGCVCVCVGTCFLDICNKALREERSVAPDWLNGPDQAIKTPSPPLGHNECCVRLPCVCVRLLPHISSFHRRGNEG